MCFLTLEDETGTADAFLTPLQLQGMDGQCWDADYDTATANDPGHFRARGE